MRSFYILLLATLIPITSIASDATIVSAPCTPNEAGEVHILLALNEDNLTALTHKIDSAIAEIKEIAKNDGMIVNYSINQDLNHSGFDEPNEKTKFTTGLAFNIHSVASRNEAMRLIAVLTQKNIA